MLDANNDKLSSKSSEKKINEEIENIPLESAEEDKDDIKEELSDAKVETKEAVEEVVAEEVVNKVEVPEVVAEAEEIVKEDVISEVEVSEVVAKADEIVKEEVISEVEVPEVVAEAEEIVKEDVISEVEVPEVVAEAEEIVKEEVISEVEVPEVVVEAEEIVEEKLGEKEEAIAAEISDEKTAKDEKKEIPQFDLSKLSIEGIVDLMYKLLNEFDIKEVKNHIETLKTDFQKKFKALIAEKKEAFVAENGNEIDFFYTSPIKGKFDELIREYKKRRQQIYKNIESEQKENLETRLLLIDELKALIDNADGSTMYKKFKVLQDKWRAVGQIPHTKYNDVWRTYDHHVERFYDLLHLNNDFRDLDFKHNLEEKTKLVEKAEALAENEDVNFAFKELQLLHKMWKEEVGPVARELREDIWQKFSEATKKIHQKKHEFQDKLDEKFKANVGLKLAVIEKIKEIELTANDTHKAWQERIKKTEALREEFFAIGKVPKSKNEEIWQLFRDSTKAFNAAKNAFYKSIKKDQSENLVKKLLLVKEAEEMKESDDWANATEMYKRVQAEWKKIGHVPRRDSDKIWKRFKDACNHYFDRLHEKDNVLGKDQSDLIENKKEFIESLKAEIEKGKEVSLEDVEVIMNNWRVMGVLPQKVKHLDAKFNKVLDAVYKKLDISKVDADFLRFKSSMNNLMDQKNARKLDGEQLFIRRKIDEITREIKQLENNISFISNASEDNPLVKNVYTNIENYKKDLEIWKRKISFMKKLEY